jgi:hypothetical protein
VPETSGGLAILTGKNSKDHGRSNRNKVNKIKNNMKQKQ